MSLHAAAQHLSGQGRGPDNTLVHMSSNEVKSLNELAMAHGGQLTINPQTGLPEAGFLSKLLPAIIGVGLTAATGGAAAPWMIGLGVGGAEALRTGDLKKGLMAGLGAYGGAGIGSAFATSGAQAAVGADAGVQAAQQTMQGQAANLGNLAKEQIAAGTFNPTNFAAQAQGLSAPYAAAQNAALEAAKSNFANASFTDNLKTMGQGVKGLAQPGAPTQFLENLGNVEGTFGPKTTAAAAAAPLISAAMNTQTEMPTTPEDTDPGQQYLYSSGRVEKFPELDPSGREQTYFQPKFTPISHAEAKRVYGYAGGGPIEKMSNQNAIGANTGYPMADISKGAYATPFQTPISQNVVAGSQDIAVDPYTGQEQRTAPAPQAQFARGGLSDLGDYSDGGRLLKGPGDGVSDSIPAVIGKKQPARLADGEFVVPARIVSELGNGSTEAGARKLYAMMDRIQKARGKTVGKGKVAKNSRSEKYLPA